MKNFNFVLFLGLACLVAQLTNAFAEGGGVHGGGGDAITEKRIKDIRDNLLFDFINKGEDKQLDFRGKLTLNDYENGNSALQIDSMKSLLVQGAVVVNAIKPSDEDLNDELKNTRVNGARKVCKGIYAAKKDGLKYIICDADAFNHMDANPEKNSDLQTIQIAHEYHSMAGIEKNIGSDSDYWLSKQLASHMGFEVVRKLVASKHVATNDFIELVRKYFVGPGLAFNQGATDWGVNMHYEMPYNRHCSGMLLSGADWINFPDLHVAFKENGLGTYEILFAPMFMDPSSQIDTTAYYESPAMIRSADTISTIGDSTRILIRRISTDTIVSEVSVPASSNIGKGESEFAPSSFQAQDYVPVLYFFCTSSKN